MHPVRTHDDLQPLRQARLLSGLDESTLRQLNALTRTHDLAAGERLLSPLQRNPFLYLLLDGELLVYLGSAEGAPLFGLGPGDCCGESSFIDNAFPSTLVIAEQPSRVLAIHREELLPLLASSPQLLHNLLSLLSGQLRHSNRLLTDSEQSAHIDPLTSCFNRRWLEKVYLRESTRCSLNQQPLCMLMLDVDHFKAYNDQHGHLAGDHALCQVANTLRSQLRPKDSLVRYGGEEFVVLLPGRDRRAARTIGERLRQALERLHAFHSPLGLLPGVTISIGMAEQQADDSLASLINRADAAMYRAKQHGRNCLCE